MPKRSRPGQNAKKAIRTSSDKKLGDRGYSAQQFLSDRSLHNVMIQTMPLGDRPVSEEPSMRTHMAMVG